MSQPNSVISEQALAKAASVLGVDVASIKAVQTVETKEAPFNPDGTPVILYERHIMYRELQKKGVDAASIYMQHPDLVHPAPFPPGGYGKKSEQAKKLEAATKIDRDCALMACSWGAFQILGQNYKACGMASIQAFVNAMYASAESQLQLFVNFILGDKNLLSALRKRDWAAFAKGYNGPGYKAYNYDDKLAVAYKSFTNTKA